MSHKVQIIFILVSSILFLHSCENNQENNQIKLFRKFESEFQNSIKKSDAKNFEYNFDGLTPQKSYFVNCKLKYLTIRKSGELITTTELITFENDSISKIIQHIEIYEGNDNGNSAGRNWNKKNRDSIYVIDYIKRKKDIYVNNKLSKSVKQVDEENEFLYKVKKNTEKNYNCR